ncbi:hypothetical protein HY638_04845 [Candidatus Woesearchaeota archaeon]|nr:hypothetical protein [Candidatus Woesearchaeota archaeon]
MVPINVEECVRKIDTVRAKLGMPVEDASLVFLAHPLWDYSRTEKYSLVPSGESLSPYEVIDFWLTGAARERRRLFFEVAGENSRFQPESVVQTSKAPEQGTIYLLANLVEYLLKDWPKSHRHIAPEDYLRDIACFAAVFSGRVGPVLGEAMRESKNQHARYQAVRYAKSAGSASLNLIEDLGHVAGKRDEKAKTRALAKAAVEEIQRLAGDNSYNFIVNEVLSR